MVSLEGIVLVVTAIVDVTADWVIAVLGERGVPVARIDPADIGAGLVFSATIGDGGREWGGRLRTPTRDIALEQIRAVYYRRPSPWRFEHLGPQARDFATPEARHGLGGLLANLPAARYVNHPAAVSRADFKPAQLHVAARLGLPVPPTLITNDEEAARKFAAELARSCTRPSGACPRARTVTPGRSGPSGSTRRPWMDR